MTLDEAKEILERRDRAYLDCDMEGYLDIWAEDMTIDVPNSRLD